MFLVNSPEFRPCSKFAWNGVVNTHSTHPTSKFSLLPLIANQNHLLFFGLRRSVYSIHDPIKRIELVGIDTADDPKQFRFGKENSNAAKDFRPLWLEDRVICNSPFPGSKFPSMKLLLHVELRGAFVIWHARLFSALNASAHWAASTMSAL